MDAEGLRIWHERGESGCILAALEPRAAKQAPRALLYLSAALIDQGREREAEEYVNIGLERADAEDLRADLLALHAFIEARRGNFARYLSGTRRAARLRPTLLALYHLGLASVDPQEGFDALHSSLQAAEAQGDQHAAVRSASALAVPLLRLGRYREARHWLHYGELRCQHEGLRVALLYTRACVQVLLGETEGLEAELRKALNEKREHYPWLCEPLSTALADLLQTEGRYEEAFAIYHRWLTEAPRSMWPRHAHGAVRALVALERREEALTLARTAVTVAGDSLPGRAVAQLAVGLALWPEREAGQNLHAALMAFAATAVPLATEAALHLVALGDFDCRSKAEEVLARLQPSVQALGRSGLALLGGRTLEASESLLRPRTGYELRLLGQATALRDGEAVRVRPRGLEILALLSAYPEGMTAASLGEGIYGEEATALRVELYRLRKALGAELERSPYRLAGIGSDVQDIDALLRSGRVREAVGRYRGPLLPRSQAPGVVALREALETQLVEAALLGGDLETIWNLVQVVTDDLRLWEALLQLPADDPRRYAVKGRVAWLRKELGLQRVTSDVTVVLPRA